MSIELAELFGTPNLGVFCLATDSYALIPVETPAKFKNLVEKLLKVPVYRVSISSSALIGVLSSGNSNGIILPRTVREEEVMKLKRYIDINVVVLSDIKETALGNLILVNDKAAIVSTVLPKYVFSQLSDVLGVEIIRKNLGNSFLVGSLAVVSNKGLLLNPLVSDNELEELSQIFNVPANVGTVNKGSIFLRAGILVNSNGALVGNETTGHELMRIQQTLFP